VPKPTEPRLELHLTGVDTVLAQVADDLADRFPDLAAQTLHLLISCSGLDEDHPNESEATCFFALRVRSGAYQVGFPATSAGCRIPPGGVVPREEADIERFLIEAALPGGALISVFTPPPEGAEPTEVGPPFVFYEMFFRLALRVGHAPEGVAWIEARGADFLDFEEADAGAGERAPD
jgi:hypothetical protein